MLTQSWPCVGGAHYDEVYARVAAAALPLRRDDGGGVVFHRDVSNTRVPAASSAVPTHHVYVLNIPWGLQERWPACRGATVYNIRATVHGAPTCMYTRGSLAEEI